ncbi:NADH-ubiquinone oxidoreductase-F iron-sulfur binding region domain-containing protein [Pseudofrankia asymbiotica]|uniref:NADH dehydrogenase n=1 Tax=Pseudofrankia asymbiotica TaxID=1834516 RepID=A0A1V2ID75_9ACTN|nr:NADH-ubiquinone oxidoreductase-F iron-sulfur binding region domain-containing protein [Pseudofrankia asymbiotica]ONH30416.1 NADH dehydrogenase [Pseudofrankia asymbiotica]
MAPSSPPPPDHGLRLFGSAAENLAEHLARLGPVPWRGGPGPLIDELRGSGLTGRGGAGFPVWRKLAAASGGGVTTGPPAAALGGAGPRGGPATVIANAAEGEPESRKDAWLLTAAPHLVLDGLALAAEAVAAAETHVYVKPGPAADAVTRAIAERRTARLDRVPPDVRAAPAGVFVAGEAAAAAAAVAGRPARPFPQWIPLAAPAPRGAGRAGRLRRPVIVLNAETLAHLALVARYGAGWFRGTGAPGEPGTMLVTVSGAVIFPGLVEVPTGATLGEIAGLAGGAAEEPGAIRVGGYGGGWVPAGRAHAVPMSRAALTAWDAGPGPGLVHVLPARLCGLAETARIVGYLAGQSAGQCGPCRRGLPELAAAMANLSAAGGPGVGGLAAGEFLTGGSAASSSAAAGGSAAGDAAGDPVARWVTQAAELAELVDGRGACRHPDGAARLVRTALRVFAADLAAHAAGRCVGSVT